MIKLSQVAERTSSTRTHLGTKERLLQLACGHYLWHADALHRRKPLAQCRSCGEDYTWAGRSVYNFGTVGSVGAELAAQKHRPAMVRAFEAMRESDAVASQ